LGPSEERSQLKVPILTQARNHQPQELRYHEDNFTISWQAPQDQEGLIGYVVSWCSAPKNSSQICDDHYPIHYKELEPSQQQLTFVRPIRLHNVAVSAKYKDGFLGGKPRVVPRLVRSTNETYNLWLGFYIGLSALALQFLLCVIPVSVRKLHKSSDKLYPMSYDLILNADIEP